MAGIDEVLERLVTDPEFRARLADDPAGALSGYMLYDEDLEVLAAALSDDAGASSSVEQRTSKTTLAGLLAAFEGAGGDESHGRIELGSLKAGSTEVANDGGNEIVLDAMTGGQGPEEDFVPTVLPVYEIEAQSGEVAVESLELQQEGFETEGGYFDGRTLAARDLAGERSSPESGAATSGDYIVTNATHQAVGSDESLAVGADQTETKVPGSESPDITLKRGHISTD